jgi:phage tail sheath protein FI
MPEYLAPGVYVEETSFRAKSIEGVGTSTTAFVGPTRKGPVVPGTGVRAALPEVITSFADFVRLYGGLEPLSFAAGRPNYVAQAAFNYFNEGGVRLYVMRVAASDATGVDLPLRAGAGANEQIVISSRFTGARTRDRITFREILSPATARAFRQAAQGATMRAVAEPARITGTGSATAPFTVATTDVLRVDVSGTVHDISFATVANPAAVTIGDLQGLLSPAGVNARLTSTNHLELSTVATGATATLEVIDPGANSAHANFGFTTPAPAVHGVDALLFRKEPDTSPTPDPNGIWRSGATTFPALPTADNDVVPGAALLHVAILVEEESGEQHVYDDVSFARTSPQYFDRVLPRNPVTQAQQLQQSYWLDIGSGVDSTELHTALFPPAARTGNATDGFSATHIISGGSDGGSEPAAGVPTDAGTYAAAFEQLRAVEDVSIVAAPGHSSFATTNYQAIQGLLISHASQNRAYRIAVLDTPPGQTIGEARTERSRIDSNRAAMYYPWVIVANPLARPSQPQIPAEIALPPSGFVCGIYARNDVEQGVSKSPANEVVRGALRFENDINFAQQQVLNPLGVNCLRFFSGRGLRVWGARTASSDPEFKYVNVRRFFLYLESSIDRGTQWVVFENNGPRLWANVRETVEAFLYNEWVSGNLLGSTPKEAYFVRCDRSTMTQNDLDNGRLICLVGVAALKPAEFVIFRIGQKTADERS